MFLNVSLQLPSLTTKNTINFFISFYIISETFPQKAGRYAWCPRGLVWLIKTNIVASSVMFHRLL